MQLIKEIGANSVRLSHYQHDDYFYQRCDEEGILVWAEVPFISIISENEAAEDNIREQMRRLILQCGNHTSVYCWGVQNEITIAGENEEIHAHVKRAAEDNIREQMRRLILQCGNHTSVYCWGVQNEITIAGENEEIHAHVKRMSEYTKNLDPDRYTAEANIYSVANESPINREITIAGENEEIHAHVKRMSEYTKNLDPDRYTAEANIYSVANESPINRLAELVGYNLYYGWYYDTIPGLQKRLDEFHAACPDIPLLVTEYGVDTNG